MDLAFFIGGHGRHGGDRGNCTQGQGRGHRPFYWVADLRLSCFLRPKYEVSPGIILLEGCLGSNLGSIPWLHNLGQKRLFIIIHSLVPPTVKPGQLKYLVVGVSKREYISPA